MKHSLAPLLICLFLLACGKNPSVDSIPTSGKLHISQLLSVQDISFARKAISSLATLQQPMNSVWPSFQHKDKAIALNRIGQYSCLINHDNPATHFEYELTVDEGTMRCSRQSFMDGSAFSFIDIDGIESILFQFDNVENNPFQSQSAEFDALAFLFHEMFHMHQKSMPPLLEDEFDYSQYKDRENVALILLETEILYQYTIGILNADDAARDLISVRQFRSSLKLNSVANDIVWEAIEGTPSFVESTLQRALGYTAEEIKDHIKKGWLNGVQPILSHPISADDLSWAFGTVTRDKAYQTGSAISHIIFEKTGFIEDRYYSDTPYKVLLGMYNLSDDEMETRRKSYLDSPIYIALLASAEQILIHQSLGEQKAVELFNPAFPRIVLPNIGHFKIAHSITLPNNEWIGFYEFFNNDLDEKLSIEQKNITHAGMPITLPSDAIAFMQQLDSGAMMKVDGNTAETPISDLKDRSQSISFSSQLQITDQLGYELTINGSAELVVLPNKTLLLLPSKSSSFRPDLEQALPELIDDASLSELRDFLVTW